MKFKFLSGDTMSNSDQLHAALPACYTNPELAKPSIRYVIKHSEADGEVKRGNSGTFAPGRFHTLPGQELYSFWEPDIIRSFQSYCSHPHTRPLFCYFKLKE